MVDLVEIRNEAQNAVGLLPSRKLESLDLDLMDITRRSSARLCSVIFEMHLINLHPTQGAMRHHYIFWWNVQRRVSSPILLSYLVNTCRFWLCSACDMKYWERPTQDLNVLSLISKGMRCFHNLLVPPNHRKLPSRP